MEFLTADWLGTPVWFWLAFIGIVIALTVFDLGILHKEDREMGIGESLKLSAFYISIALAFGVPPMLLGIPGDNTFANFMEANRSFWRQTVLPMASRMAEAMTGFLCEGGLRLAHDLDQVEALAADREALWARVGKAEFLTDDEKRQAVGYGAK